jgi:hypothetical protein
LSLPESNHLLTVRAATWQILATSPVVNTCFPLVVGMFVRAAALPDQQLRRNGLPIVTAAPA